MRIRFIVTFGSKQAFVLFHLCVPAITCVLRQQCVLHAVTDGAGAPPKAVCTLCVIQASIGVKKVKLKMGEQTGSAASIIKETHLIIIKKIKKRKKYTS